MLIRLQGSIACGEDDYATIQEYWAMVGEVCALMRPYQQQVGDIVSAHDDFEEAVAALIDKIQRFKRALREEQVVDWKEGADGRQEPVYGPPLNSTVCRKVFAPYHLRDGVDFEHEVEGVQS